MSAPLAADLELAPATPLARGLRATEFKVVRVGVGLLLVTAAGLKTYGLALDPVAVDSFLFSPRMQIAAVELEIVLGLLLLANVAIRYTWMATLGFFTLLAGLSLYQALDGQAFCGCLGKVQTAPWVTFGLDVLVIGSLLVFRPVASPDSQSAPLRPFGRALAGTVAIVAVACAAFLLFVPDPTRVVAHLRGETITVEPSVTDVGAGSGGQTHSFTVRFKNNSALPVHVLGRRPDCFNVTTEDLPVELPPGEERAISVQVSFAGGVGQFHHPLRFFTNAERQPIVAARIAGRVIVRD